MSAPASSVRPVELDRVVGYVIFATLFAVLSGLVYKNWVGDHKAEILVTCVALCFWCCVRAGHTK